MKKTEWKKLLTLRNVKKNNSYQYELAIWNKRLDERTNPARKEEARQEIEKINLLIKEEEKKYQNQQEELKNLVSKIDEELHNVQGRATERTLTSHDVLRVFDTLTKYWNEIAPKKALKGLEVCINMYAQTYPSAYKYSPATTFLIFVHDGSNFILSNIVRAKADKYGRDRACYQFVSDDLKNLIIENALKKSI